MITFRIRKKPSVPIVKAITYGISRRSLRQLSSSAAAEKVLMTHDQNRSDPACPPHSAVSLKKRSEDRSVVAHTYSMWKSPLTWLIIMAPQAAVSSGQVSRAALRAL